MRLLNSCFKKTIKEVSHEEGWTMDLAGIKDHVQAYKDCSLVVFVVFFRYTLWGSRSPRMLLFVEILGSYTHLVMPLATLLRDEKMNRSATHTSRISVGRAYANSPITERDQMPFPRDHHGGATPPRMKTPFAEEFALTTHMIDCFLQGVQHAL